MGYTHDTNMKQFIPPVGCAKTAGTWTPTVASDVVSDVRSAAAATFNILIPLNLPSNSAYRKGSQIVSVDVWYTIGTADMTDFATVTLEQMSLAADTVAITSVSNTGITLDSNHDTAAKRKVQAAHKMTVTITAPIWIPNTQALHLNLACSAAAGSIFTLFGAQINYVERN